MASFASVLFSPSGTPNVYMLNPLDLASKFLNFSLFVSLCFLLCALLIVLDFQDTNLSLNSSVTLRKLFFFFFNV